MKTLLDLKCGWHGSTINNNDYIIQFIFKLSDLGISFETYYRWHFRWPFHKYANEIKLVILFNKFVNQVNLVTLFAAVQYNNNWLLVMYSLHMS